MVVLMLELEGQYLATGRHYSLSPFLFESVEQEASILQRVLEALLPWEEVQNY